MKNTLLIAGLALFVSSQAHAQQAPKPGEWSVSVGAGAVIGPQYLGDSDARILPIPYFDIQYGPNVFFNVPRGLGAYLWNHTDGNSRVRWGVSLSPGFNGRDGDDIPGLPAVDISIEARSFVEYSYKNWSLGLTAAQDLGTGHEGFYVDANAGYSSRIGERGFGSIGVSARYADDVYMDSFYTVTNAQSLASGLDRFNLGSGFESVALQGLYTYQFDDHWQLALVPELRLAVGDVTDSPLTAENVGYQVVTVLGYRF